MFVVEGVKSVFEFLQSEYVVEQLYYTPQAATKMPKIPQNVKSETIGETELKKISALKTPQGVLAVVRIPSFPPLNDEMFRGTFHLVLDDIQDPGNLGTIIRTAEWFGMKRIICSSSSVDAYNPKVVQASMGSLSRMQVYYTDVAALLKRISVPVFGAVLDGTSVYRTDFGQEGVIVLGNEGNGIGDAVLPLIDRPVTIPRVGQAESLNVAVSAAVFCAALASQVP